MSTSSPLLLLHGALGAGSQFAELRGHLAGRFETHAPDLPGHGGTPIPGGLFSIEVFAEFVRDWIVARGAGPIDIFGYSMGGYVALYLARQWPEGVGRIFTLATKFDWNPDTASREAAMLDPVTVEAKVPKFAEQLRERHGDEAWRTVLERTAAMMIALGERPALRFEDLAEVRSETMIGIGDRDRMVTIEESLLAYRSLGSGRFIALPATPHPLERVSAERLAHEIGEFFPT